MSLSEEQSDPSSDSMFEMHGSHPSEIEHDLSASESLGSPPKMKAVSLRDEHTGSSWLLLELAVSSVVSGQLVVFRRHIGGTVPISELLELLTGILELSTRYFIGIDIHSIPG